MSGFTPEIILDYPPALPYHKPFGGRENRADSRYRELNRRLQKPDPSPRKVPQQTASGCDPIVLFQFCQRTMGDE